MSSSEASGSNIAETITGLYLPAFGAYKDFLVGGDAWDNPVVPHERSIYYVGPGLFFAMASRLAQQKVGVCSRIDIRPDAGRNDIDEAVLVHYASDDDVKKEEEFLGAHWNSEIHGSGRELLFGLAHEWNLASMAALHAGVSPEDISDPFPHLNPDSRRRFQSHYRRVSDAYQKEPELASKLIVLDSLRRYRRDSVASQSLTGMRISLLQDIQKINPLQVSDETIEELVTTNMSENQFRVLERVTLEKMISEGTNPLTPSEYAGWLLRMITED